MAKNQPLTLVQPSTTNRSPPRQLGASGVELWRTVQSQFAIDDAGGVELLTLACETLDLAAALAASIERDGVTVYTNRGSPKPNPAVKDLIGARALTARLLQRLGITDEVVKPAPGRPPQPTGWTGD